MDAETDNSCMHRKYVSKCTYIIIRIVAASAMYMLGIYIKQPVYYACCSFKLVDANTQVLYAII